MANGGKKQKRGTSISLTLMHYLLSHALLITFKAMKNTTRSTNTIHCVVMGALEVVELETAIAIKNFKDSGSASSSGVLQSATRVANTSEVSQQTGEKWLQTSMALVVQKLIAFGCDLVKLMGKSFKRRTVWKDVSRGSITKIFETDQSQRCREHQFSWSSFLCRFITAFAFARRHPISRKIFSSKSDMRRLHRARLSDWWVNAGIILRPRKPASCTAAEATSDCRTGG